MNPLTYIKECFSMQKTPERVELEKQHTKEWKESGASLKEVFCLDKDTQD